MTNKIANELWVSNVVESFWRSKDKNNRIFVIPNVEKPIKIVFQDRYNIEETTNGLIITERISLQKAIKQVKAAGNDPNEFIDMLIRNGKWEGTLVWEENRPMDKETEVKLKKWLKQNYFCAQYFINKNIRKKRLTWHYLIF